MAGRSGDDRAMTTARLDGRVAVVTGAASGIGRAIAMRLAADGATVVGLDRVAVPGTEVRACDVTDEAAVAAALADLERIDVLVPCAGIGLEAGLLETSLEDFNRVLGVNLTGVFLCAKHAVPRMPAGSSIVLVASMSGVVATDGEPAYCASKAGAIGLARALAVDLAGDGIRVNAVCPGVVDTPMLDELWEERGAGFRAELEAAHPLGRLGTPAEIANVVTFLASPESSFVTGAVWAADGGYTAQ